MDRLFSSTDTMCVILCSARRSRSCAALTLRERTSSGWKLEYSERGRAHSPRYRAPGSIQLTLAIMLGGDVLQEYRISPIDSVMTVIWAIPQLSVCPSRSSTMRLNLVGSKFGFIWCLTRTLIARQRCTVEQVYTHKKDKKAKSSNHRENFLISL